MSSHTSEILREVRKILGYRALDEIECLMEKDK